MVHLSETCEPTAPHLLTHVQTTPATVHEAQCTAAIQQALVDKDLPPSEHLVDAAYIDAALLVTSDEDTASCCGARPGRMSAGSRTSRGACRRALRGRVGTPAGALSPGQDIRELGGACRPHGRPVYPGAVSPARLWCLWRSGVLYTSDAGPPEFEAPSAGAVSGAARGSGLVCQSRRGSSAISGGPASKGRCPRACAALGYGVLESRSCENPLSNTWRRPRR